MPMTPHGRWDRWRKNQASRFRGPRQPRRFVEPMPTFVGVGQSLTQAITLTQGCWRVVVEIAKNARRTLAGLRAEHLLVLAMGEFGHFEVLVCDTVEAGRWTAQILVANDLSALPAHGPLFALPEGAVKFDVQTAASSAVWSISVDPF